MTEEQIKTVLQDVDPETEVFIEAVHGSLTTKKGTIEYDKKQQLLMFVTTVNRRYGLGKYKDVETVVAIPYDQVSMIGVFLKAKRLIDN